MDYFQMPGGIALTIHYQILIRHTQCPSSLSQAHKHYFYLTRNISMKLKYLSPIIAFAILSAASSAQAHDPNEHMKDAEKPNCNAMENMDHSKMDMNDPVMKAMMKQCIKDIHHSDGHDNTSDADQQGHQKGSDDKHSNH
jgi:hypothetical protein